MPQSIRNLSDSEKELRKALQYYRIGEFRKAEQLYRRVAKSHPTHKCFANLGAALQAQGRFEEAIKCYEKSLDLKPDYAEAYFSMGSTFHAQNRLQDALSYYEKAVEFNPNYAAVYHNIGILFQEKEELDEAITYYRRALELKPDFPVALNSLGTALQYKGKRGEAISYFEKALQLNPDYPNPLVNLLDQLQQTCSWTKLSTISAKLDARTESALRGGCKPAETPFHSLSRHIDPRRQFLIARLWSTDISEQISKLRSEVSFDDRKLCNDRIRIGYLSNDFNDHPIAHLMLSMFGLHNRHEFKIFCYSHGIDDGSRHRKRIERDCDKFVDVMHMSHADAARCVWQDKIDILVELGGYTKGSRLEICAFRPAPIQVSYLGFPGTTGADFIDYIITDKYVTPESQAPHYSEKFVYLPHSYQVNDNTQTISNKRPNRADVGLPEKGFVFASFNQEYKIEPVMFSSWMNILKDIPKSVLWLMAGNDISRRNLQREAHSQGVNSGRLFFADKLPTKEEHLGRLALAGLALDTRVFNGHTTTSDALWAGVPVITLEGSHFASRVSSSILTAIGLPELITHSLDDYETLAVWLACNADELQEIRQRLANNRLTEPLFDTPRFARNLEKAYKEMWKIFLTGEKPRQIEVMED